jgi:chloramphenicol 3-O-phosphotransferase
LKLIIIYGPPAAGKHTVGQKLAELTGCKFFYNHLTVDVVRALFDDEDERRDSLLDDLRIRFMEAAVQYDINTVFTMAYHDDERSRGFAARIIETITRRGGTVHFVRLNPPDATLYKRITNESRVRLRKPSTTEHLDRELPMRRYRVTIDYPSSIILDTSKLSPLESARRIIEAFDLAVK